jgi:hypothetical protein
MDGRSWSPRDAVRREDQFTQAPDFYDEHDSDHLPMWGRISASWHGMAPARRVLAASSLLAVAGVAVALALAWAAQPGAAPSQGGPLGASEGGPSVPSPAVTVPSVPGNLTASASSSSGAPLLPPPALPSGPS